MKRYLTGFVFVFLAFIIVVTSCTRGDPLGLVGVRPKPEPAPAPEITPPSTPITPKPTPAPKPAEPEPEPEPAKPPPKLAVKEADHVAGFVDFSGVWTRSFRNASSGTCKGELNNRGPHCAANFASHLDWMQLKAVSTNVTETKEEGKVIIIKYEGEYHHGHSFYKEIEKQKSGRTWNTMAHVVDYVYKLEGDAKYSLDRGYIRFGLNGELTGPPLYDHTDKIAIIGEDEGFGVFRDSTDIYSPEERLKPAKVPEGGAYSFKVLMLGTAKGSAGSAPKGMGSSVDCMLNINYRDMPVYWRSMVHESQPLTATGVITGLVESKSGPSPERGTVQLFREENEETPIKETSIKDGVFTFYKVPIFTQDESKKLRRQNYTVKVVHTEADVDPKIFSGMPVVYWRPETVTGVQVPGNLSMKLDALPEIGIKQNLITALSELGKNNYADIEVDAKQWVEELSQGEMTDLDLEKLRRGIWAERIIREGAESADASLKFFLEMTANLFAELWGDGFKSESQKLRLSKKYQADRNRLVQHHKEHGTESTAKLFNVDPAKLNQYEGKLDYRAKTADLSDRAGFWNLAIKQMRIHLLKMFKSAGMDTDTAEEISYWCALGMRSYLGWLNSGYTKRGATSLAIKDAINYTIKQMRPIIFDNRVELDIPIVGGKFKWDLDLVKAFPSYTSLTRTTLDDAVKNMKAWDKADFEQYQKDSMAAKEILDTLIYDYTNTEQWHHYLKALTDTADVSSDVLGLIGKLGAKQFTVASEIMGKAKYVFNAAAIVVPAKFFFWDAPRLTTQGVAQAYGVELPDETFQLPPIHDYVDYVVNLIERKPDEEAATHLISRDMPVTPLPDESSRRLEINQIPLAEVESSSNQTSGSPVTSVGDNFKQAVSQMVELLNANEIGQAIELSAGDSPETYESALSELSDVTSILLNQASSLSSSAYEGVIADTLADSMTLQMEFKAEEAAWSFRMWEFFNKVILEEYTDPSDPYYIAERNRIVVMAQSLQTKADELMASLNIIVEAMPGTEMLPTVNVRLFRPESMETGDSSIMASPEEFSVRAHISNLSSIPVSELSALLVITSPKESVAVVGEAELPVGSGTLVPGDSVRGSGEDEADVEWTIRYQGDLTDESILLAVYVLESGRGPVSFLTFEGQQLLLVDPLQTDKDFDGMFDEYELENGLDMNADDSEQDADNDGLTNLIEFEIGTRANQRDSDGDGLSDGEEYRSGEDGFVTDPLNKDTDGDGVPDNFDRAPDDATTSDAVETPGDPEVAVDKKVITLTPEAPIAAVIVTNSGEGTLYWIAGSLNDALAVTCPEFPSVQEAGILIISVPPGFIFEAEEMAETVVRVVDAFGADTDWQEIVVRVGPGP